MIRHRVALLVLFLSLLMGSRSAFFAEESVTGRWKCTASGLTEEPFNFVLELKQSGSAVTGKVVTDEGEAEIVEGSMDGSQLRLITESEGVRYTSNATVEKDNLKATWKDTTGRAGSWTGVRSE